MITNNHINEKYNKLTIIAIDGKYKNRKIKYKCQCDCGNITYSDISSLKNGNTKSCGCLKSGYIKNLNKKHNESKTRLYRIWVGIKNRCYNPKAYSYKNYGGRGITMCDEWKNNYENFREWANKNGYQDYLSIERKNYNGNYCPENCEWATAYVQSNNTRRNRFLTINGITRTISQWANESNISSHTIRRRIKKGITGHHLIMPSYTYSVGRKPKEQVEELPVKIVGVAVERRSKIN